MVLYDAITSALARTVTEPLHDLQHIQSRLHDVFAPFARSDVPGGTVAVSLRGEPLFRRGFGLADVEQGIANLASSRIAIGSITKQFTCAAVLALVREGTMGLDDPIGHWLPELSGAQRDPSIRQLMNHTGGVRCYLETWGFNGFRTMPSAFATAMQLRQTDLDFRPGEAASYSNGGYLLLSLAVQRASGLSLDRYLAARIFAPIGMMSTTLPRHVGPPETDVASLYRRTGRGAVGAWRLAAPIAEEMQGEGGVLSTADDLLRWADHLQSDGSVASIDDLTADADLSDGESRYGFGLISEHWRGQRVVQHAGALPGANSVLMMVPAFGLSVAVLFNRNAPAIEIGYRILEVVLGDRLTPSRPAPSAASQLGLIGRYLCDETGLMLGFVDRDGSLEVGVLDGPSSPLTTVTARDGELPFVADVGMGGMRFRVDDAPSDVATDSIEFLDGGVWRRARRIVGAPPTSEAVLAAIGCRYRNRDLEADVRFDFGDGRLVARFRGAYASGVAEVVPVVDGLARLWFADMGFAMLLRWDADDVPRRIVVSTSRTRSMVFERCTTDRA